MLKVTKAKLEAMYMRTLEQNILLRDYVINTRIHKNNKPDAVDGYTDFGVKVRMELWCAASPSGGYVIRFYSDPACGTVSG